MKCTECPDYRECNKKNDLRRKRQRCTKRDSLEKIVDLDKMTEDNNAAMRKVMDFITRGTE